MTCELCPRRCQRRPGFCGAGEGIRLFRWGPHFGEEPPVTGTRGSGCVFFSHCTMKCLYCQNSPWSWCGKGEEKTQDDFVDILRHLALKDRVENWNLVSPTPYLPFIREAATRLKKEGVSLPFVWNSSGYERVETLEDYAELCDVALFDLRYSRNETAKKASQTADYVENARAAVRWAYLRAREKKASLIVRLLVLPGHADEAIENLAWMATTLSNEIAISVMSQFTPAYKALETPPFNRTVTADEYESVTEAAADFGFEHGWIQDYAAADPRLALFGENMTKDYGALQG